MDKYYNDKGEVGVIVSHGYGAGWSTWGPEANPFNPVLIKAILEGKHGQTLEDIAKEECPRAYAGGLWDDPTVYFMPEGTEFRITEYDGYESIEFKDKTSWLIA